MTKREKVLTAAGIPSLAVGCGAAAVGVILCVIGLIVMVLVEGTSATVQSVAGVDDVQQTDGSSWQPFIYTGFGLAGFGACLAAAGGILLIVAAVNRHKEKKRLSAENEKGEV